MRDSAFQNHIAIERTIVEALAELKSQATVTKLYVQEMRSSLNTLSSKINNFDERIGLVESAVKNLDSDVADLAESNDVISKQVDESVELAKTVQTRQQALISEIRLISHFKQTGSNDERHDGYESELAVDGLFMYTIVSLQWMVCSCILK